MEGQLFSSDFLLRGITETEAWRSLPETELDAFIVALQTHFVPFSADSTLNEAQTESELVEPILDLLGWENAWLSQVNLSLSGRDDVPDFLLFATPQAKASALDVTDSERSRHGIALLEAKRWLRPLDRSEEGGNTRKRRDFGAPSSQMLRYLSRADVMSDRAVKWGMLTNGGVWRLYWQDARSRAENFFELDLAALIGVPGTQVELGALEPRHGLKVFLLFFGRLSFLPQAWDSQRRSFHAIALEQARLYEETVSALLGQRVFADVFPALCQSLADGDLESSKDRRGQYSTAYLNEVREAALILLYRLLFLFYAEDRRLLPIIFQPGELCLRPAGNAPAQAAPEVKQAVDRSHQGRGFVGQALRFVRLRNTGVGQVGDGLQARGGDIQAVHLAFSYTAHDLAAFARDLGYVDENGLVKPPFVWNAEDRAQRLARLDALFFHLYGLGCQDAEYILSTFPIVREHDLKAHGHFVTCERTLAYLRRIEAGQLDHAALEVS